MQINHVGWVACCRFDCNVLRELLGDFPWRCSQVHDAIALFLGLGREWFLWNVLLEVISVLKIVDEGISEEASVTVALCKLRFDV